MATRKKHIRTPYEDERKKHRAAASRHVLALEAQIKEDDKRKLFHIANDLRVYGNHLTNIAQKRVSQLFRTKAYREALKQYHNASSVLSSLDKGTPKYHEAKEKVKDAADVLERLQAQYKLTMEDLRHDMAEISKGGKNHFHVVDNMYRASQYDHKSNSYNKKKLSQRWHKFEDGTKVQRDIYSAFLLLCHNDDFKTINQDICISKYETFKKAHDKCVSDIKASGHKVCNSGI